MNVHTIESAAPAPHQAANDRGGAAQARESLVQQTAALARQLADQMLNLTRGHVERTTSALWRVTEHLVEEMQQLQNTRVNDLQAAFAAMRAAQAAYWQTTQQVHSELVALVQAPLQTMNAESEHGTH